MKWAIRDDNVLRNLAQSNNIKQENKQECREKERRDSYFFHVFKVYPMWCQNPLFIGLHRGIQKNVINMTLNIWDHGGRSWGGYGGMGVTTITP